jgi:hypothetical protein
MPTTRQATKTTLEAELAQLRADIVTMNEIANSYAIKEQFCRTWERIIDDVNEQTGGRLGLSGRDQAHDVILTVIMRGVMVKHGLTDYEIELQCDRLGSLVAAKLRDDSAFAGLDIELDEVSWEHSADPND